MIKNITRLILITLFAYFVFDYSVAIDIEQFYKDLKRFRPFVEIYLLHFLKYNFYFLINLISISTIFIIFRIYGYSRLALLVYLVFSTTSLYLSDKIKNK